MGILLVALATSFSSATCRGSEPSSALSVPAAPAPPRAAAANDPIEVDLDAAIARAAAEGRPLFVHFTADWCQPCKELKATVYPAPEVAARLQRFVRAEIDVQSPTGRKSALHYGVQTIPVLMTLNPQGEELRSLRIVGARTASQLATTLDKALEQCGIEHAAAPAPAGESAIRPH